ncbi:MAG: dTDP-4-keto-L-rhamnose reductase [Pseudomonadota bacterium]|jgi:dTDP-4-dehydrorhamnose reductase
MTPVRLVVLGPRGQVGWELMRTLQPLGQVIGLDRPHADLDQPDTLAAHLTPLNPDVILNAAAWTAVDAAETQEAQALRVNGEAPGVLAQIARACGALLVHYSTDYVFDGSGTRAWCETDATGPINAYGRTKLAGEHAVRAAGGDWLILRTSWVYGSRGANFVRTMLRLGRDREHLRVVGDQVGAPTPARLIAEVTAHAVAQSLQERRRGPFDSGVFHLSAAGQTSWHGFAQALFDQWRGLAPDQPIRVASVESIPSVDYPTPAARPLNSRLCCDALEARFGVSLPAWQTGLALVLSELNELGR